MVFQFMRIPTLMALSAWRGPSSNTRDASETLEQVSIAWLLSSNGVRPSPSSVSPTALTTQLSPSAFITPIPKSAGIPIAR